MSLKFSGRNSEDYFFSGWIGNLGVEPLLRAIFLRARPCLFNLLARFVFVTRVRDTIFQLLYKIYSSNKQPKAKYLPIFRLVVKNFVFIFAFLLLKSGDAGARGDIAIKVVVGEHQTYELPSGVVLKNYSLADKSLASTKYLEKERLLLFKGKREGQSELLILGEDKKELRKKLLVVASTKGSKRGAPPVTIGEVKSMKEFKRALLLSKNKQHGKKILVEARASEKLQEEIIQEIRKHLEQEAISKLWCEEERLTFYCFYEESTPPSAAIASLLSERFNVKWVAKKSKFSKLNYRFRLKLVQLECSEGEDLTLGFSRVNLGIADLFEGGVSGVKRWALRQEIFFENRKYKLSTLAAPEVTFILGEKHSLEMGAKIPIESKTSIAVSANVIPVIEWHFAGLRVQFIAALNGERLLVKYENEFSGPSGNAISGSKESSQLFMNLGEMVELFQIGIQTMGNQEHAIPGLGAIPLFGKLFTATSNAESYKRIYGLATIDIQDGPRESSDASSSNDS
ncbi:MAG: hypothetical protein HQK50_05830 [Oligoflexia bacterium]|nr:hypothetical protein [Oligoflexia bacterium]MBF0365070.1 hypothetical protein [Oligoflexia bacterium]